MLRKKKKRIIVEARYKALVTIFDKRGAVLEALGEKFGDRLTHWKVDNASILFTESEQSEALRINVGHNRSSFVIEDYSDENQAIKDAIETFTIIRELFSKELKSTGRLGIRFIDVLTSDKITSFDEAHRIVKLGFFNSSIPLTVPIKDIRATLNFERGSLNVGPVQSDENWCREIFASNEVSMPDFGIGLDVDSYIESTSWSSSGDVAKSIRGVSAMTNSIQGEIVNYLSELASGTTS
jgi:hypothetical protein